MAVIQYRGDLQWRAIIRRKGYPTQTKTFDLEEDARRWARRVERDMDKGEWSDTTEADTTTLSDALERYMREIASNKKGKGWYNNKYQAANVNRHKISKISLSRLRGADVAEYRDHRLKSVGANTVRLELALISHLFTIARSEWGMEYLRNPVQAVRKPSVSRTTRDRRLLPGEEEKLLQACEASGVWWLAPVVRLAIETAMRRGEIVSLEWQHIDLKGRVARLYDTKNGEDRQVPLSSRAIGVMESLPRSLNGRVFDIRADRVSKEFDKARRAAGIEDLRFHDLRHEGTSRLFEKGLNQMQVASITGHKTLQMLSRYTHLKASDLAAMLG